MLKDQKNDESNRRASLESMIKKHHLMQEIEGILKSYVEILCTCATRTLRLIALDVSEMK